MKNLVKETYYLFFPESLPYKRIAIFILAWFILFVLNFLGLRVLQVDIGTPLLFPFSVFGLSFNASGITYAILFIFLIFLAIKYELYTKPINTYILGLSLIVLGNMSLGDIELAFYNPIAGGSIQYYHDSVKIENWKNWLSSFNNIQESLLVHARTHPPGAVLIGNLFFTISKNPIWIAIAFLLLSSLSIVLIYKIFIELGKDKVFSSKMAFLYSVIPAINIYSLATLDALIAMLVNVVLLGIIILIESKNERRVFTWGLLSSLSIVFASFLTFGILHMWAVLGMFSFYQFYFHGKKRVLIYTTVSSVLFLFFTFYLNHAYNFNYLESFFTASRLENKHGFMLTSEPLKYFATRIENVLEIAIFLSISLIAVLSSKKYDIKTDIYIVLPFLAIGVLILMFFTGAYKTGETARACMFIIGFVMILLKEMNNSQLTTLISFAAMQTLVMQLFGNFFW